MSTSGKPCVLIVDDDFDLAEVMRHALGRAGFEVHTALSGQAAIDWLAVRTPDVVLLDLMMPDINGFTILRRLRSAGTTGSLPVIVVTARSDHQSRAESQSAGADLILTKPVKADVLVQHVRQALASKAAS